LQTAVDILRFVWLNGAVHLASGKDWRMPLRSLSLTALCVFGLVLVTTSGCGGGGNGGPAVTPGTPTRTPTRTLRPGEPTFTPTRTVAPPSPTPTQTPVQVQPGSRGIVESIRVAPPGAVVAVPAGVYAPFRVTASDLNGPITVVADVTGQLTGFPAGEVVINAAGAATGISLEGVDGLTVDGFTVRGATRAGIEIREGNDVTIRNSIVRENSRDGMRLLRAAGTRIWNNLILRNGGPGVSLLASSNVAVVNNTFYANRGNGLVMASDESGRPAEAILARNNIFVGNTPRGITVDSSTVGFDGDYNLNRDGFFNASAGPHDLNVDPLWLDPGNQNGFRIPGTDDECRGGSAIMDAGDPDTDPELLALLAQRTTQVDNKPDCIGAGCCPPGCVPGTENDCVKIGAVDLGYHYPIR
jgi:parallel beta-helix repeat protein